MAESVLYKFRIKASSIGLLIKSEWFPHEQFAEYIQWKRLQEIKRIIIESTSCTLLLVYY